MRTIILKKNNIIEMDNNILTFKSYGYKVATINNDVVKLYKEGFNFKENAVKLTDKVSFTVTTLRMLLNFLNMTKEEVIEEINNSKIIIA